MDREKRKIHKCCLFAMGFLMCMLAALGKYGNVQAAKEKKIQTGIMETDADAWREKQRELEEEDYINQHLFFAQSDAFMDRMDSRFSHDLKDGLDTRSALFAEAAYDLLDDLNSISKVKFNELTVFENPYDAILAEILLSLSDQKTQEIADWSDSNAILEYGTDSAEYIKKLTDLIYAVQPDCEIPQVELSIDLKKMLFDWKGMKKKSPELYKKLYTVLEPCMKEENAKKLMKALDGSGKLFDGLNKFIKVANDVQDAVECTVELYNFYVVLDAYSEMSQEMLDSLHNVSQNISNDIHRSKMDAALDKMDHYLKTSNIADAMIEKGLWKSLELNYEILSENVIQPAMIQVIGKGLGWQEAQLRSFYAVVKAYNVGWSLSDALTGNDVIAECREEIRAAYFLCEAVYNEMAKDRDEMQREKTYKSACKFNASYSILRAGEQYALEVYKKYLKAQQESFIQSVVNVVILQKKDYNKQELLLASNEKLQWEYARCHTPYGISGSMGRDYLRIHGSVNVSAYDDEDNLVFTVKNGKTKEYTGKAAASKNGKEIQCCFAGSGVYRMELESYGSGTFEVEFEKEDPDGNLLGPQTYLDADMKKGDCYQGILYSSLTGDHASTFEIRKYETETETEAATSQAETEAPQTETVTQTETAETQGTDWDSYMRDVLVPQYGVMPTRELSHDTTNGSLERWSDEQSTLPNDAGEPLGLLSANIMDFDGDGQDEMLVTYWGTMIVPHTTKIVTDLNLWMYEQKEDGEIVLAAEKKLGTFNGNGYGNGYIGYIQTGCMTWTDQETRYIGIDNYLHANESITTLDIYRYDGTSFCFEKGLGYQMQGNGDYYVRRLNEENVSEERGMLAEHRTFCGEIYEMNEGFWETVMEFHPDQPDGSYVTLSSDEAMPYFDCYQELAGEYGLNIQPVEHNWRYAEEQSKYYFVDMRNVYQAQNGDMTFLAGVFENTSQADNHSTAYLQRCDMQGSLDAYR